MPYQQVGNLWSAWPRFFLMLLVMLLLNSLWAYASLNIDFVKVPADAPDERMALSKKAFETNMLIRWGLGTIFNGAMLVRSLRQRHVGESIAAFIGMLWLTCVTFSFYLMVDGLISVLQAIQGIKH